MLDHNQTLDIGPGMLVIACLPQPLAQALAYCSSPLYVSLVCELAGRAPAVAASTDGSALQAPIMLATLLVLMMQLAAAAAAAAPATLAKTCSLVWYMQMLCRALSRAPGKWTHYVHALTSMQCEQ
jgi:hypothetical protein